jgi:enterochelin esterase-like enzyme
VSAGSVETTTPHQDYLIYLPPCYEQRADLQYPTVYLLHGQTYNDDEWVRLGAAQAADRLILSGEAPAFIIVFPDDRYWNLEAGPGFGERLIGALIPYVDAHYRTRADREGRALGGLSRGGGWSVRLGLTRWDLFSTIGLHSPAIFSDDSRLLDKWIEAVPAKSWPRLWLDAGDRDRELGSIHLLEDSLSEHEIPHEFHLYAGDHSEAYWSAHVEEYLRWYTEAWVQP